MSEPIYLQFRDYDQLGAFLDALRAEASAGGRVLPRRLRNDARSAPWGLLAGQAQLVHRCDRALLHWYRARIVTEGQRTLLIIRPRIWLWERGFELLALCFLVVWGSAWTFGMAMALVALVRTPSLRGFAAAAMMLAVIAGAFKITREMVRERAQFCSDSEQHAFTQLYARHRRFIAQSQRLSPHGQ